MSTLGLRPHRNTVAIVLMILVSLLSGCAAMTEALVQYGKDTEEANRNAPPKVCPQCGRVYEHNAIIEYCRVDGMKLVLKVADRPAEATPVAATTFDEPHAEPPEVRPQVVVVLVHGTTHSNAWGVAFEEDHWCEENDPGAFVDALRGAYLEDKPTADVQVVPFHWNGDNSNADRHNGGVALAELLDSYPTTSQVVVIAHSHGGNVALRALTFSERDAETVVLLGTPFLGVNMQVVESGKGYRMPLYLPLPSEIPNTRIVNVYSPQDSVAAMWADIFTGTSFSDLSYTNAESWRHYWRLDRVKMQVPRKHRPGHRTQKVRAGAAYDFDFGDGVIDQRIDESLEKDVMNISLPAQTGPGTRANWVHTRLHSAQVATALGHALATNSFTEFADSVGTLHQ